MLGFSGIYSVFRPETKPISEVLHGEVSKVKFIFYITHRRSEIVLFGSYFIPAMDFSVILLFLHLTF